MPLSYAAGNRCLGGVFAGVVGVQGVGGLHLSQVHQDGEQYRKVGHHPALSVERPGGDFFPIQGACAGALHIFRKGRGQGGGVPDALHYYARI